MDLGKVAVYQGGSVPGNVRENLAVVRDIAEDARRLEAHTVVFPELFLAGYDIGADQLRATAVAIDDAPIREARALALEKAINIVLPFAERRGNQIFNAAAVIARTGEILTVYRKCHLWSAYERDVFTPGGLEDMRVVALPPHQLRIGVLICYDVEFPEPARVLALRGAQMLVVPTALAGGPVEVHTPARVIPTRALENHLFVAYSNFPHEQNLHNNPHHLAFCGQSALVGPNGEDLERCNHNETRLLVHAIRFGDFHRDLARNPYWHDRRPELYADLLKASRD